MKKKEEGARKMKKNETEISVGSTGTKSQLFAAGCPMYTLYQYYLFIVINFDILNVWVLFSLY